ncbi:MAG: NAD-dependent protein deacylase [Clostridiales bacterium]|nr:NAD-dependent protein deacylase [Clostridiales bacterium]
MDRYEGAREKKLEQLKQLIKESKYIVFLGGAGVSTESGIPDFRSGEGIFNQESGLSYRPVDIISHSFFEEHPEEFFDFYRRKLLYPKARPNKAHRALVRLEKQGKLKATITQNIDNLHQMAGSTTTIELHGSVFRNYCVDCKEKYDLNFVLKTKGVPRCPKCGGIVRPDMILYEEHLEHENVDNAVKAIKKADLLIIGGTSLTVYPAATFAQFLKSDRVVIINKSSTYLDLQAMLTIHDSIGTVLDTVISKYIPKKKPETAKKTTKKKTTSKTSSAKKPAAGKTESKASAAKKPAAKSSSSKKPAAKTSSAKKPSTKASSAKKPAAKKAGTKKKD